MPHFRLTYRVRLEPTSDETVGLSEIIGADSKGVYHRFDNQDYRNTRVIRELEKIEIFDGNARIGDPIEVDSKLRKKIAI